MSGERIRMMTNGLYIPDSMVVEQKKPITAHEKTNLKLRVENNELVKQLSKVKEERDRAVNLIERLAQWKDAYPESVFTPVDLDAIADREGLPVDCISAQVLRVATVGWSDEAERFLSSLTENKS